MNATKTDVVREAFDAGVMNDEGITQVLDSLGDRAVPELIACLDDPEVGFRAIAITLLGRSGDTRAVPAIVDFVFDERRYECLQPKNLTFRVRVFKLLSPWWRDTTRSFEETEPAIDLSRAAYALGQLGSKDALPALRHLENHPHELVRSAANDALALLTNN